MTRRTRAKEIHGRLSDPNPFAAPRGDQDVMRYVRRHLRVGWWSLLLFLTLGLVLESLHGFKVGFYLDVSNEVRRLMWTLAHAHGTLLSLVHLAFAATLPFVPDWKPRFRAVASCCLISALVLIPGGFFLGGVFIYSGDPGLGVLLVPVGAVLLFAAVFWAARSVSSRFTKSDEER